MCCGDGVDPWLTHRTCSPCFLHITDDPTWNWLTFKTGDVSQVLLFLLQRSFCSRLAPIDLHTAVAVISVGILYRFCNIVCVCVTLGHLWGHLGPCGADSRPVGDRVLPETAVLLRQHHRWHQVSLHETRQDETRHTVSCLFCCITAHSSSVYYQRNSLTSIENCHARRQQKLSWCSQILYLTQGLQVGSSRQGSKPHQQSRQANNIYRRSLEIQNLKTGKVHKTDSKMPNE